MDVDTKKVKQSEERMAERETFCLTSRSVEPLDFAGLGCVPVSVAGESQASRIVKRNASHLYGISKSKSWNMIYPTGRETVVQTFVHCPRMLISVLSISSLGSK